MFGIVQEADLVSKREGKHVNRCLPIAKGLVRCVGVREKELISCCWEGITEGLLNTGGQRVASPNQR